MGGDGHDGPVMPDLRRGDPLAVVVAPGLGVGLAWAGGSMSVASADPAAVVAQLEEQAPRWVWWSARVHATGLVQAGVRPRACWDLGAVSRLLHGEWREDEGAVWALHRGLDVPPEAEGELSLLDLAGESDDAVRPDGQLSREWLRGSWSRDLDAAQTWARLALEVQQDQERTVRGLPDRRREPGATPLPYLTALSESMAALLAVELGHDGLAVHQFLPLELIADAACIQVHRAARRNTDHVGDTFGRLPGARLLGRGGPKACDRGRASQSDDRSAMQTLHEEPSLLANKWRRTATVSAPRSGPVCRMRPGVAESRGTTPTWVVCPSDGCETR